MRAEAEDAETSRRSGLHVKRRMLHLLRRFPLVLEPSYWYVDPNSSR